MQAVENPDKAQRAKFAVGDIVACVSTAADCKFWLARVERVESGDKSEVLYNVQYYREQTAGEMAGPWTLEPTSLGWEAQERDIMCAVRLDGEGVLSEKFLKAISLETRARKHVKTAFCKTMNPIKKQRQILSWIDSIDAVRSTYGDLSRSLQVMYLDHKEANTHLRLADMTPPWPNSCQMVAEKDSNVHRVLDRKLSSKGVVVQRALLYEMIQDLPPEKRGRVVALLADFTSTWNGVKTEPDNTKPKHTIKLAFASRMFWDRAVLGLTLSVRGKGKGDTMAADDADGRRLLVMSEHVQKEVMIMALDGGYVARARPIEYWFDDDRPAEDRNGAIIFLLFDITRFQPTNPSQNPPNAISPNISSTSSSSSSSSSASSPSSNNSNSLASRGFEAVGGSLALAECAEGKSVPPAPQAAKTNRPQKQDDEVKGVPRNRTRSLVDKARPSRKRRMLKLPEPPRKRARLASPDDDDTATATHESTSGFTDVIDLTD